MFVANRRQHADGFDFNRDRWLSLLWPLQFWLGLPRLLWLWLWLWLLLSRRLRRRLRAKILGQKRRE
jgi:hypothetical protein